MQDAPAAATMPQPLTMAPRAGSVRPVSSAARRGQRPRLIPPALLAVLASSALLVAGAAGEALAGVQFVNCSRGADGSISCDTVPTGNTRMNDIDARYGLLQQASPGWSEFDPYAGYNEDFGGNET